GWIMFKSGLHIVLLGAFLAVTGVAQAQEKADGKSLPVDTRHLVVAAKTAVIAVNQANLTNNYSVLRELAAPGFRDKNSAKDLEKIFAKLRESNLDFSPILVYNPKFADTAIMPNGLLRLRGYFPTQPLQVHFDLLFQPVGGEWRLYALRVAPAKEEESASKLR
ncbi:MAG: hypothetical protein ACOC91_02300, partial [bacterium]